MATNKTMLVVDDDATTRWALRSIFAREGWEVLLADTMASGLEALASRPRFAILDLNLPDGKGEVILAAIRARNLPTRVAVCSSTTDAARVASVMAHEPELMLAKPLDVGPIIHLCRASA